MPPLGVASNFIAQGMKRTVLLLSLFILVALAGLAIYLFVNPKKALDLVIPDIESLENLEVKLEGDTAQSVLKLGVKNKGWFTLNIDSLMYRLRVDSTLILSRTEPVKLRLKKGQADTIYLHIPFPYKRVSELIKEMQGQDSMDVIMRLRIAYSTIFGKAILPIRKVTAMQVPIPPRFEIDKVEYKGRERRDGLFVAYIRLHNYGKVQLRISDLYYRATVEGMQAVKGSHPETISVKPHSEQVFKMPFRVAFPSALKALGRALFKPKKVDYRLHLSAMIQNDKVGQQVPVQVEKKGQLEL